MQSEPSNFWCPILLSSLLNPLAHWNSSYWGSQWPMLSPANSQNHLIWIFIILLSWLLSEMFALVDLKDITFFLLAFPIFLTGFLSVWLRLLPLSFRFVLLDKLIQLCGFKIPSRYQELFHIHSPKFSIWTPDLNNQTPTCQPYCVEQKWQI